MKRIANASPAAQSLAMSTKPRRRSAITALFAAAIVLLLVLPSFSSADPLTGSATFFKEGLVEEPHIWNNTPGPEGNVWFVDNGSVTEQPSGIGKIDPEGAITEYCETGCAKTLSGLNPENGLVAIATGPEGKLWVTDYGKNPGIAVIDPTSCTESGCTATEYSTGLNAGAKPEGIVAFGGKLWFADVSATTPAIGVIDPSSPEPIEEFTFAEHGGNAGGHPQAIVVGPDGNLWFADGGTTPAIGKIDPSTHEITEYPTGEKSMPGNASNPVATSGGPWGIAVGADGNVWFTENGGNTTKGRSPQGKAIGRITPSGTKEEIEESLTYFSAGLVATSNPRGLTAAPGGKLWFTDSSGVTEAQTISFSGATTGQEFKVCNEVTSTCATFTYQNVASSANRTTLRNNIQTAYKAIYGASNVGVSNGTVTTTCGDTCGAFGVSFPQEGELVNTNVATTCEKVSGTGTCSTATTTEGVPNAIGSIDETSGTIARHPINGLYSLTGIAYSGGNAWFNSGVSFLTKIGKFGIEPPLNVKVTKTGTGSGTVTSEPSGINCGSECSKEYASGTEVTLTQSAAEGSEFIGWTGCDSESEGKCIVNVSGFEEIEVEAQFDEPTGPTNRRTLTITKSAGGTGGIGSVKSKPKGINCATACTKAVGSFYETGPTPSSVTLTATPASGSSFVEWTGACASANPSTTCTVSMSEDKAVGVVFSGLSKAIASPTALTLSKGESPENSAYGSVKASGLYCEAECTETTVLYQGTVVGPPAKVAKTVELSQTPYFGSEFLGWSGCDKIEAGKCFVTMTSAKAVTAEYAAKPNVALTVAKNSEEGNYTTGTGTVTSKPKGLKCATTCTKQTMAVPSGEKVVIKAKAASGMEFKGWAGAPCAEKTESTLEGTCTISPASAKTVVAKFQGAPKAIANPQALTLTKAGSGFGYVKASGLACEALCTSAISLYAGTVTEPKPKAAATVTLEGIPSLGSKAVAWSGCDEVKEGKCVVSMTTAKAVTASFDELE